MIPGKHFVTFNIDLMEPDYIAQRSKARYACQDHA